MIKKSSWKVKSNLVGFMLIIFCAGLFANSGASSKSMGLGLDAGYALFSEDNLENTTGIGLNFFYFLSKQFKVELKTVFIPINVGTDPEGLSDGKLNMIPAQLSLQYCFKIGQRFTPYIGAGVGYYLNKFSLENEDEWQDLGFNINEEVDGVFGFHFGAGMDYFVKPNMAFNIDVRYCIANLTGSYTISEEVTGISHSGEIEEKLDHILFGVGIKFLF